MDPAGPDLAALRTAIAVAEELHFGRAGERLGIAQPQVSQRVRRLEKQLGLLLFERDNHHVALTSAGEQLLRHARSVVAAADRLVMASTRLRAGSAGVVRIGAVGSAFFGPLPRLLAPCREALPGIELRVSEMESPQQLAALADGSLDIGFLRPPAPAGWRCREVWSEPLVVAVPADDELAGRAQLTPSDLAGRDVVLFPRDVGPGYWDQVAAVLAAGDAALRPVAEADHVTTVLGLVSLGVGLTLVPDSMRSMRLPNVRYVPLRPGTALRLAIVTSDGELDAPVRSVLAHVPSPAAG
jgi:DNA-binding transcriptional LysR family regulator